MNYEDKLFTLFISVALIIIFIVGIGFKYIHTDNIKYSQFTSDEISFLKDSIQRTGLFKDHNLSLVYNGVYFSSDDYYCVWVANRSLSSVDLTDRHEHCHSLVHNDSEHFCGWYK